MARTVSVHQHFGCTVPFGRLSEVVVPHPERTATVNGAWSVTFYEWPSRGAMLTTIEMQGRRASHHRDYHEWKRG